MTRDDHVTSIIEAHGCADEAELPEVYPRYLLLESDNGPADNGGPWFNFGDSIEELLDASNHQEEPDWWPAEVVFDLDTGEEVWKAS